MPLFDFRCNGCRKTSELLVAVSAAPACPHCGSRRLRKLVSAPTPPGRSAGIIAAGRARAAREGHFSHYRKANGKVVD